MLIRSKTLRFNTLYTYMYILNLLMAVFITQIVFYTRVNPVIVARNCRTVNNYTNISKNFQYIGT